MVDPMGISGHSQKAGIITFWAEVIRGQDENISGENLPGVVLLQPVVQQTGSVALGTGHGIVGTVAAEKGQIFVRCHHFPKKGQSFFPAEAQPRIYIRRILEAEEGAVFKKLVKGKTIYLSDVNATGPDKVRRQLSPVEIALK